jgi:UDP-N-acetylmuramoyl-L-alanyl-D-glutamate--2,6-diaminopimelate ligase
MLSTIKKEVLTIGIFGSNGKTSTANLLLSIFNNAGLIVNVINDEKDVIHKGTMTNNDVYKQLKNMENSDIIIIEMTESFLKNVNPDLIEFDILIHCHICENSYENSKEGTSRISSIISSKKNVKTVILNTDDNNWKNLKIDLEKSYLITYGLGNKATVTASSIECGKNIKFCYCLQRALTSIYKEIIVPLEVPISMKAIGQYNVYNGLAAITAAHICGININNIALSLNNAELYTGLKLLYENGFCVVDNLCENALGLETGFDAVQNLPYENVHLIFNLDSKNSQSINKKVLEVIVTWAMTLRIKNMYFIDNSKHISNFTYFNKFKNSLGNSQISIVDMGGNPTNIEGIVNILKEKDMLLFFCSRELNGLRDTIVDTLDKRILGSISGDIA